MQQPQADELTLYGERFNSRFLLGTALYNSPELMRASIETSRCEIVTLGLRRQNPGNRDGAAIWQYIQDSGCRLLPNTAGCKSVKEVVTRSEEHTSELQSRGHLVCRLLLEK